MDNFKKHVQKYQTEYIIGFGIGYALLMGKMLYDFRSVWLHKKQ